MTLIELLIAILVSTLILSVAFAVFFTFSGSFRSLTATPGQEAIQAMDEIRQDLTTSAQAVFSNTPVFAVQDESTTPDSPSRSTLAFCASQAIAGQPPATRPAIRHVRYQLRDAGGSASLIKESVTLWGPEAMSPPSSNAILRDILAFEVQVLGEKGWTNRWTSSTARLCPKAARVRLDWLTRQSTNTLTSVVFIPAGNGVAAPRPPAKPTGHTRSSRAASDVPTPAPRDATGRTDPRGSP